MPIKVKREWSKSDFDDDSNSSLTTNESFENVEYSCQMWNKLDFKFITVLNVKKVNEVKEWLNEQFNYKCKCLILSGPPGSGKSSLIHNLCKNNNILITVWEKHHITLNSADEKVFMGEKFDDFMLRASKYNILPFDKPAARSIILLEDKTNHFDINKITQLIPLSLLKTTKIPIVILTHDDKSVTKLTHNPDNFAYISYIKYIKFPPITERNVIKAMSLMTSNIDRNQHFCNNNIKFGINHDSLIKNIAQSSRGDMRYALNLLQFYSTNNKDFDVTSEENTKIFDPSLVVSTTDVSYDIFHATGKILYHKLIDSDCSFAYLQGTSQFIAGLDLSTYETLMDYVQYNQILFFDSPKTESFDLLTNSLCDASSSDMIYGYWEARETLAEISTLLLAYSYIVNSKSLFLKPQPEDDYNFEIAEQSTQNEHHDLEKKTKKLVKKQKKSSTSGFAFKPLNRPPHQTSKYHLNELRKELFGNLRLSNFLASFPSIHTSDFLTETVPYCMLIGKIQNGSFQQSNSRFKYSNLYNLTKPAKSLPSFNIKQQPSIEKCLGDNQAQHLPTDYYDNDSNNIDDL